MAPFGESGDQSAKRSTSRPRTPRPTTPLRPSSRSSFRDSARASTGHDAPFPLNTFEPAFAELADSMADLEANLMHLQIMHESLARFGESFAGFLYGLNMNAFCVDFPEVGIPHTGHQPLAATVLDSNPSDLRVLYPSRFAAPQTKGLLQVCLVPNSRYDKPYTHRRGRLKNTGNQR